MVPSKLVRVCLILVCLVSCCKGYELYQQRIPNGDRVPHPCIASAIWQGVGHENAAGGGSRNPFGIDFAANSFVWDKTLCEMDSDGDGLTNGEELGDANCTWTEGEIPARKQDITHPGICEPLDATGGDGASPNCTALNTFPICKPVDFICNATNEDGARPLDLRLAQHEIPAERTNYACIVIPIDDTTELHAFAMEPLIDQPDIVHHIDLKECREGEYDPAAVGVTRECGTMSGCGGLMLATWTLGMSGVCLFPEVGIRMGKFAAKAVEISVHYHNPFEYENRNDSSGLRMWVTENLRPYDAQVFNIHQLYLEIPPGEERVEQSMVCSADCTKEFEENIYLVFGGLHMHYLGTGGRTELIRDGEVIEVIMETDYFDYNSPYMATFDTPIEVRPGDVIKHTCIFQSLDRTTTTWQGSEAVDEMCESVVIYYPAQNMSECYNFGKVQRCGFRNGAPDTVYWGDCDIDDFDMNHRQDLIDNLSPVCDKNGETCLENCTELVNAAHNTYTCLGPDYYEGTMQRSADLRNLMRSCAEFVVFDTSEPGGEPGDGSGSGRMLPLVLFIAVTLISAEIL